MQGLTFCLQTIARLFNEFLSINLSSKTAAPSVPLAQGKELKCHVLTKLPKLGVSRILLRESKNPKLPGSLPSQELPVPSSGSE